MMKLSTRSRYGVRIMFELAKEYGGGPLDVKTIARREGLSQKYIGQIIIPLKSAGLVRSEQGKTGGYFLAEEPGAVTVLDIVRVLEGSVYPVPCTQADIECEHYSSCGTMMVWRELNRVIEETLNSYTLQTLVDEAVKNSGNQLFYSI
jgi:Rrf2 family protein